MIISLFHNYMSLLVTLIVEPHYSIEYTVYAPMWYRTEIENNIYISKMKLRAGLREKGTITNLCAQRHGLINTQHG